MRRQSVKYDIYKITRKHLRLNLAYAKKTLLPILFNLALEKIVRDTNEQRKMNLIGKSVILAYSSDIVVLGNVIEEIIQTTKKLLNANKSMDLCLN